MASGDVFRCERELRTIPDTPARAVRETLDSAVQTSTVRKRYSLRNIPLVDFTGFNLLVISRGTSRSVRFIRGYWNQLRSFFNLVGVLPEDR